MTGRNAQEQCDCMRRRSVIALMPIVDCISCHVRVVLSRVVFDGEMFRF